MNSDTILVCSNPTREYWQLGPLPPAHGRLAMFGWHVRAAQEDAGIPPAIATALAGALTRAATVIFPCSSLESSSGSKVPSPKSDRVIVVEPAVKGVFTRVRLAGWSPSRIVLLSTRDPKGVLRLFDDARYPWWLQGQFALLTDPDDPVELSDRYESLTRLLGPEWTTALPELAEGGVRGILRPGVDGDVAGLLSTSREAEDQLLTSLRTGIGAFPVEWQDVSEEEFAQAL